MPDGGFSSRNMWHWLKNIEIVVSVRNVIFVTVHKYFKMLFKVA
jgi:hypothetical protein